jgi:hypothetical protein
MPSPRRFPPPWTIEELDACFVVIDSAATKIELQIAPPACSCAGHVCVSSNPELEAQVLIIA